MFCVLCHAAVPRYWSWRAHLAKGSSVKMPLGMVAYFAKESVALYFNRREEVDTCVHANVDVPTTRLTPHYLADTPSFSVDPASSMLPLQSNLVRVAHTQQQLQITVLDCAHGSCFCFLEAFRSFSYNPDSMASQ